MKKKQVFEMNKKWIKFRLQTNEQRARESNIKSIIELVSEQHALYPVRVEMQVDFTDNETTEESFVEDIEKAIQGVIDTSGVNVEWTVNDYTIDK